MNAEPQVLPQPANVHPLPPPSPPSEHRGRSKISRLPKKLREQLNQMLADGVEYEDIKTNLGEYGKDITVGNISEWKLRGGYKPWCNEQVWREEIAARIESFTDLITDNDPAQLGLGGLQFAFAQLCEQLRGLGPGLRAAPDRPGYRIRACCPADRGPVLPGHAERRLRRRGAVLLGGRGNCLQRQHRGAAMGGCRGRAGRFRLQPAPDLPHRGLQPGRRRPADRQGQGYCLGVRG